MQIPDSLLNLLDQGVLEDVVRPLLSGKEAQVFVVVAHGEEQVAKVYKEAQDRTFKNRAAYTEGRRVRNSRDQRAMAKRSRYGRGQDEKAWRSTEVDMIYKLRDARVRVPTPYHFIDGVLLMELVRGPDGHPAARLGEVAPTAAEAEALFKQLLAEVVRMLCADVVHGDLSEFNVLMGAAGPVIIDFPQAVYASANQGAERLLARDVDNLQRFLRRFSPRRPARPWAQEIWQLYRNGALRPDTALTGAVSGPSAAAKTGEVLALIDDARRDAARRHPARPVSPPGRGPAPADRPPAAPEGTAAAGHKPAAGPRRRRPRRRRP